MSKNNIDWGLTFGVTILILFIFAFFCIIRTVLISPPNFDKYCIQKYGEDAMYSSFGDGIGSCKLVTITKNNSIDIDTKYFAKAGTYQYYVTPAFWNFKKWTGEYNLK